MSAVAEGSDVHRITVAVVALLCGAAAATSAEARTVAVRISAPASLVAGAPCRVVVSARRAAGATVLLQERATRRWRSVARAALGRRPATLRCPTAGSVGATRRFRAILRRRGQTVGRSRVLRVRVVAAPATPGVPPATPVGPPAAALPPAVPAPPARLPLDPGQFGVEGTGGPPGPETLALLSNPNVVLSAIGRADLAAGRIDPRIVVVLARLAAAHRITVGPLSTDHSKFTVGGSVSPHFHGRGVDIAAVDGQPVTAANAAALALTLGLAAVDPAVRPDEIGSPWVISAPGYFTDSEHQTKVHIAFRQPIDPAWTPPAR